MRNQKYKKEKASNVFEKTEIPELSDSEIVSAFSLNSYSSVKERYLEICKSEGYPLTRRKRKKVLIEEAERFKNKTTKNIFKKNNNIKKLNLIKFIEKVDLKELEAKDSHKFEQIYNFYQKLEKDLKEDFKIFADKFKSVKISAEKTHQVQNQNAYNRTYREVVKNEYQVIIENIFKNKDYWINSINDFKLKTKNPMKALESLIQFLFLKYEIEKPLFSLFSHKQDKYSNMFIRINSGEKPKKVFEDVIPEIVSLLSKKQIHSLLSNPSKLNFFPRCREVMLEDKHPKILKAVSQSVKMEDFQREESLFQEFIIYLNNKKTDLDFFSVDQIMPLFDYVITAKNRAINTNVTFKLKDHTLAKLYEDMMTWHRDLGKSKYDFDWESLDLDYHNVQTKIDSSDNVVTKEEVIIELTSGKELRQEGSKMKHCVASYARSCKNGTCAIFSLRTKEYNAKSFKNKGTIELRNGSLVQIRGTSNTPVDKSALNVIKIWAKEKNLSM